MPLKTWLSASRPEYVIAALVVLTLAACAGDKEQEPPPAAGSQRAAGQGAEPASGRYALTDFAQLRWLEGDWRGTLPDGGFFYERYRFVDDSTIVMHGFADSTFSAANDSARITLRGQTVANEGGARSVATALDSRSVSFAPTRPGSNHFTWTRDSEDAWTATLRPPGQAPRITVYKLERIGR